MGPGSFVILHLQGPTEKFWGVLLELQQMGVLLRALNVSTFDDWLAQVASSEASLLGLTTMFVPMSRVERIFLDEQVGAVASYAQRFERRVGLSVEEYLGLPGAGDETLPS
ncbi:MAG TPA: hypothetical protein VNB06_08420 [Thermoanaerobaculia bacterium]|nr:hypothetical protein [Thermoanaerobaculia bacterium]